MNILEDALDKKTEKTKIRNLMKLSIIDHNLHLIHRSSPSSNSLLLQGIQVLIACPKHVEVQSRLEACPMNGNR